MSYLIFVILIILPGFLLLRLFQKRDWAFTKTIVFSVALSMVIIMVWGLLTNTILPLFGYQTPLSRISLIISFSILGIILLFLNVRHWSVAFPAFHLSHKLFTFLPLIFPAMAILGIHIMNSVGNNILLITLLISGPLYAIYLFMQRAKLPEHVYFSTILCIGASLLLLVPLRNPHVIGDDVVREYALFLSVSKAGIWHVIPLEMLSSSLSTNLLPAIVHQITGMDPVYVFKELLFVAMLGTPLAVYYIARKFIGVAGSFVAALFIMAQTRFLGIGAGRTEFAVFFFAMMILALLDIEGKKTRLALFTIMGVGIVLSHYTTAFIAMFMLIGIYLLEKLILWWYKTGCHLPFYYLGLFFAPLFLWEYVVNKTPWEGLWETISSSLHHLNSAAAGPAMGGLAEKTLTQKLAFFASWPLDVIIVLAIIYILVQRRGYLPLLLSAAISGVAVMVVAVALPVLSTAYSVGRAYYQMAPVFAPVIGFAALSKSRLLQVIVALALVLLFLFNSSVINQFTGQSKSLILNSSGEQYERYFLR